jgi:predicted O-methyltransferase YrrM
MVLAQAIQDVGQNGRLVFIDPSFVDDQWKGDTKAYFKGFGINCISHHRQTSQDFLASSTLKEDSIDLLFIDGYHTYEQCRLEHEGFTPLLSPRAITLFHDSSSRITSSIYGEDRAYAHTVWRYIDELKKDPGFEVVNLEIAQGVAMVRQVSMQ